MKHILAILAALVLAASPGTYAQAHSDLRFKHIGIDRGLSHATVSSIVQDSTGYIWVATPDGLNRYDGYGFRVYRHVAGDSTSPGAKIMRFVKTDPRGRLWAAGGRTLSLYDASRDRFVNHRLPDSPTPDITDLLPMPDGRILVSTADALYTFDPDGGTFSSITAADGKRINALERDGSTIYIGTSDGRIISVGADRRARTVELPGSPSVVAMLADGPSRLFIATEGAGLMRYDTATGAITHYLAASTPGLGSDYVRSLAHDSRGRIWVGTFTGLSIFDPSDGTFTLYDPKPEGLESLSHTSVRCIYADRQGGMWLGTYFGGLNYYHPLKNQFRTLRQSLAHPSLNDNVVGVMAEDTDGILWIGTNNGGLNRYNPADDSFRHFTKADGLGSNDVKAIYIDPDGRHIYIGAHIGGLTILDKSTSTLRRTAPGVENVFDIIPSRRPGYLWLTTLEHILLYDKATGRTVPGPQIPLKHITDFYRDADGRLWVYGEDGLRIFDEDTLGRLTPATGIDADKLHCRSTWVYDVYQSRSGQYIYIASSEGLWQYSPADGSVSRFTTDDGLPNNIVYGVLEDNGGNLWCSTNSGLARISPADRSVRAYSARDGLQSNQFTPKSFLRSSSGEMYFGGVNGLSYFDPAVLESNPYSPTPIITGLRLFNRPVTPGDDTGLLARSISEVGEVHFGVDQTVFTIDFTVCNYVAGEHNTFAYMLEGLDKDWYTTAGPGSVTYSNLPPGNYRFLLRAANNDGVWCASATGLDITIARVWYKRWWAVALFILLGLAVAAACIWYFWRKRAIEDQLSMERHERQRQRELNEMKVRFFINMSHELRTPLTLIQLPIEELLARADDPKTVQKLTTVKNNANRILHIVNQLLDYRRAEMGMFKLQVSPTQLNDLARKIFANYDYQAQRRGITYTLESDVPDSPLLCDPQYMELIFNNLLSNAFKYTPRGQSISMRLHLSGTAEAPRLNITVADTGCGIPADKLPEIFTRFFKAHDHAAGSGIGLSLVKRLTELHHGTIGVTSELGAGTTFTVEIPVGEADYSREERVPAGPQPELPPAPVTLPVEDDTDDFTDLPPANADESDSTRRTLLVADDNPEILKYICEALSDDYNVVPVADGAKAIQVLSQQSIDLIITDVMMPDIDGVQLCRTVKRNLRTSHIPVIILSAKSDTADQLDGLKVGADDYIGKPFSMPVLAAKIRNLLRTRDQAVRHFSDTADIEPEKVALNPLDEAFLKKAMSVMEEHLDDSQFSTDAFAREMCMSRSNLHLKMKALTGESTNEFIRRFRLRRALDLLKSGRYTVSEVSAMVGYGTPSYFATSFKKFFGSLPSDYVKKD